MQLAELQEKRQAEIHAARSLTDSAKEEGKDLSSAEQTQFDQHMKEARSLDTQIKREQDLAEMERAKPIRRGNDGTFDQAEQRFRLMPLIQEVVNGQSITDAGQHREISAEWARRDGKSPTGIYVDMDWLSGKQEERALLTSAAGQSLYPTRHRDDLFIDRNRETLMVARAGAPKLTGLKGDQEIPRLTDGASAYWVGEHEDVTPTDNAFDDVTLTPKTVGAQTEYSRRMIINASPSIENLVRSDLVKVLDAAVDLAAITGDGTGNKPTGVLNQAGTQSIDLSAGITWESVLEAAQLLSESNTLEGAMAWMTSPAFVKTARSTLKAGTNEQFVMATNVELAGYQLFQTNHIPNDTGVGNNETPVIFGNWSDLLIGYWSGADVLVNPYSDGVFSKGGVKINVMLDCDVAVRHPESFVIGTGLVL